MAARITIQSGIAAGTTHRINGRVARVGSDPQSDVCVPSTEIPSHALTLEFRDDSCRVYNRCRDSIYVGAQMVEPEQVVEWPETDILQLGPDTELLLDFDLGNQQEWSDLPAEDDWSAQEVEPGELEGHEQEAANSRSSSSTSKTVIQLMVTVACLVGCALLLVRDQNRKSGVESGPGFSEVIAAALEDGDLSPALVQRIQFAETQRIRGRDEEAMDLFQAIRDDLVEQMGTTESTEQASKQKMLELIQTRLTDDSLSIFE